MKKLLFIGLATIGVALSLLIAYKAGHAEGVRHALDDAEYWITDWELHEDYDLDLHINLDGQHYINGLFIG